MSQGPGVYDPACTQARQATLAESAILIIVNGVIGSGFSVQTMSPEFHKHIPSLLRAMADEIDASIQYGLPDTLESGPV